MALTVTDILKFRESVGDSWKNLLISANIDFNLIYPVGSIYMSTNNTNPAILFGGTWEQIGDKFLLGAGSTYTAGDTGGEAEHTLIRAELPAEQLGVYVDSIWLGYKNTTASSGSGIAGLGAETGTALKTGNMGSGQAHNNMPPYLVVYMWKRLTLAPCLTPLPLNTLGENIHTVKTIGTNTYTVTKPIWATTCNIIRTQGSNYVTCEVKQGNTTLYTFTNDTISRAYYATELTGDLTFSSVDQYDNNGNSYLLVWE